MKRPLRLLLIEDSSDDAELLLLHLKKSSLEVVHERVQTPDEMRRALEKDWDLVISDYSMPAFSALTALSLLKEQGRDLPFLVVSGTIGEETAVETMKAGAHDYLMKGKLLRLIPAIEREMREAKNERSVPRPSSHFTRAKKSSGSSFSITPLRCGWPIGKRGRSLKSMNRRCCDTAIHAPSSSR